MSNEISCYNNRLSIQWLRIKLFMFKFLEVIGIKGSTADRHIEDPSIHVQSVSWRMSMFL